MSNKVHNERYSRQILLQQFGEAAQQKLLDAKVLMIGAGGLGCPILQYLVAAGIGTLGIADADVVSLSNLQRQVLYTVEDIGKSKTSTAAQRLRQMNPDVQINEHPFFVDNQNALNLFAGYDYIIDGTDNFATRYLINDACVLLGKPLIFGAVYQFDGQVAIFNVANGTEPGIHYRHLFPVPPTIDEAPDCATAGVLGTLPGIIGMIQATETIKLITGIGRSLANRLLTYSALTNETSIIDLSAASGMDTGIPENEAAYCGMNYPAFCRSVPAVNEIDAAAFLNMVTDESIAIIDVREEGERPEASFRHQQIPLSVLNERVNELQAQQIVLFCRSGVRSRKAAALLNKYFKQQKQIYTLKGGILSLNHGL